MPSEVILPRVDMDMATGKIAKWLVEPGTAVAKGQPLFEIETDKAAMEIEAPAAGTLRTLVEASGQDIPVGSTVAWIYADGEQEPVGASAAPAAPMPAAPLATPLADRLEEADRSFDSALPAEMKDGAAHPPAAAPADTSGGRPRATPLARRLARAQGLDLAALTGSGPRGRIQAEDVERADATPAANGALAPTPPDTIDVRATLAASGREAPDGDSGPLALIRLREGTGRPVVLIHGFGAEANAWRPFLSGQDAAKPVYALDLPGHGQSGLGQESSFTALADTVEAALIGADLPGIDLVGHSLGGAIATAIAARGSLDIRSLLLLSPAGLGPGVNGAFVAGYLAATSEASLTAWMRELVVDPGFITPAFIRATLKARAASALVASQRRIADAVFPDATQAFSIRDDLARLPMQTRIVQGIADKILPAAYTAGLPGAVALHLFPHVGHMPQFEVRDAVATILEQMTRG